MIHTLWTITTLWAFASEAPHTRLNIGGQEIAASSLPLNTYPSQVHGAFNAEAQNLG